MVMYNWMIRIFIPYINEMKEYLHLPENVSSVLIMDGLKAHTADAVEQLCKQFHIQIVLLPAHSSHLTQPLDLYVFSVMKAGYRSSRDIKSNFENKDACRVDRIIKEFYNATYRGSVLAGWKSSGIQPQFLNGKVVNASVNQTKLLSKVGQK